MMVKKVFKYFFVFVLILGFNLLCSPVNLDEVWNYGFANNLYRGLIPYQDFNMVITPFYPFFMSLFFHFFGSSMLVFHGVNAFILTGVFILLDKMYQEKSWIFLLFFFFPVNCSFPNYNLFLFVLLVIILYLEENFVSKYSWIHYVIGILLACCVLTKQTVGICLLFPSFLYFHDKKAFFRRFVGFIIPIFIFLFYLVMTGSMVQFFNLCCLGLLEFSGNHKVSFVLLLLSIFMIVFTILFIRKDRKNIANYYALCFYTLIIPIVDVYHVFIAFLAFLLLVLRKIKKKYFHYSIFSIISILILALLNAYHNQFSLAFYPNDISHFEYRYIQPSSYRFTKQVLVYMKENKDKNLIFINSDAYYFKTIADMDIGYLDLINLGNLGYRGSEYLFDTIRSLPNSLFLVNLDEYGSYRQTDQRVIQYILKHGKKLERLGLYDVYTLS